MGSSLLAEIPESSDLQAQGPLRFPRQTSSLRARRQSFEISWTSAKQSAATWMVHEPNRQCLPDLSVGHFPGCRNYANNHLGQIRRKGPWQ